MKKIVIITGATGKLGKATVDKFIDEGYHAVAITNPKGKTASVVGRQGLGCVRPFKVTVV